MKHPPTSPLQILKIFRQTDIGVLDQCCPMPKPNAYPSEMDDDVTVGKFYATFLIQVTSILIIILILIIVSMLLILCLDSSL